MNLSGIIEKVEAEQEKKSDAVISLQSAIPLLEENQVVLKLGRNTTKKFTSTGLQSYLQKIDIPIGFFNKCSSDLKRNILTEFHTNNVKQDVMLRLYNEDTIRFMASSKYAKYDDINIVTALSSVGSSLNVKQFYQSDEFFILRAVGDKFEINGKPYYPGLQIMNSEVGKSSVKAQFLLWEEICTNGMVIQNAELGGFNMIHLGKDRDVKLQQGVSHLISRFDEFNERAQVKMDIFSQTSGKDLFEKMDAHKNIPQKITTAIAETVPAIDDATSLDVMSAYTEAIQVYDWDARNTHEKIAGDLLWATA